MIAVSNPTPSKAHARQPSPLARPHVTTAVFFFELASIGVKIKLLFTATGAAAGAGFCGPSPRTSENGLD